MHFFLYLSYLIPYDSQMEFWLKLSWIFFFTQVLEKKKKGLDQLELNLKKEKKTGSLREHRISSYVIISWVTKKVIPVMKAWVNVKNCHAFWNTWNFDNTVLLIFWPMTLFLIITVVSHRGGNRATITWSTDVETRVTTMSRFPDLLPKIFFVSRLNHLLFKSLSLSICTCAHVF